MPVGHDISSGDPLQLAQPVGCRINIEHRWGEVSHSTWSALFSETNLYTGTLRESTNTQNSEVVFGVVLAAGTWKEYFQTRTWNTAGIHTVSLDGVSVGTIDCYAAGTTEGVTKTLTGIVVPYSGYHTFAHKMATKNASSAGYYGDMVGITLERTA